MSFSEDISRKLLGKHILENPIETVLDEEDEGNCKILSFILEEDSKLTRSNRLYYVEFDSRILPLFATLSGPVKSNYLY